MRAPIKKRVTLLIDSSQSDLTLGASFLLFASLKFSFPESVNEKQQYKLLGNSINVAVVSELIKLLTRR
jgi:hypothetical protein